MGYVRRAAVAGMFYPARGADLRATVEGYLAQAPAGGGAPKAIIAPHAGYIYSGPVAASVYKRLLPARGIVSRVVLIGPSHRIPFHGLAVSGADAFATPLGEVPVDRAALAAIRTIPGVIELDEAHGQEHSLEVHLPFLQTVLGAFTLIPIAAGQASAATVAAVLEAVWGGPETLIVISSDLSHYLDYDEARAVDARTTRAIETLDPAAIDYEQACGRVPVSGLLDLARRRGLTVETVDVRTSGDTAGPRDRVVGYGAWAFYEPSGETVAEDDEAAAIRAHAGILRETALSSILHGLEHGAPAPVSASDFAPLLRAPGASFVTLTRNGELRGCIGSPQAHRPLIEDVAHNAFASAFRDPRFPPLADEEIEGLAVKISVLTPPRPMTYDGEADLLGQLRPGIDGLIIDDRGRRALFLPSVWDSLRTPQEFLSYLKRKAGLAPTHWSDAFTAQRFTAVEI